MDIKKIIIDNFKSINNLEFEIKKYGNSYTTIIDISKSFKPTKTMFDKNFPLLDELVKKIDKNFKNTT